MSKYPLVKLEDYVFYQEGPGLRTYQWTESGMKVITIGMITKSGTIDYYYTEKYISLDEFNSKYSHFAVEENDVVITTSGVSYGKIAQVKKEHLPMMMNTSVIRFHTKTHELDQGYLYSYLRSSHYKSQMDSYALGSAQPNFGPSHIKYIDMILPPIELQKRISSIICALNNKIDVNIKINETLEKMAITIYKHWFEEFGPFQEGEFVETEVGIIPKGWKFKRVLDLGEVVTGKTPPTNKTENYGFDIPFIKIPDMHNQIYSIKTESMLSDLGAKSQKNKYLPENTVCVSCIATPGLVCLTDRISQTNQQINSIICKEEISPYFTYLFFKSISSNIVSLGSSGTATLNLNKKNFSNIKVILPDPCTMLSFDERVKNIFNSIRINQHQIESLEQTRNYLLPRLLSGDIDLSEAEETIEKVMQ